MREPFFEGHFKRDLKLQEKRGKSIEKLFVVTELLVADKPLPPLYHDHPLLGNWKGYRDCHIESDWILIYKISGNQIYFSRTGTHGDLF